MFVCMCVCMYVFGRITKILFQKVTTIKDS